MHEIQGWDDLRRRLSADRRCFAFFHPALPGEPLIFVEVALVGGHGRRHAAAAVAGHDADAGERSREADTAIFYSISNCQEGLRGISFGNFLIKQVVEELQAELPRLKRFATLSPVPGFRRWLGQQSPRRVAIAAQTRCRKPRPTAGGRTRRGAQSCAPACCGFARHYLTRPTAARSHIDPVARFHLGNGARLERINWLGNTAPAPCARASG